MARNESRTEKVGRALHVAADKLRKPTDQQVVQRLLDRGVKTVVSVPCSITKTMDAQWADLAREKAMRLIKLTHEHSLVGVASGIYLATGEIPMVHMQNSGFPNSADGLISFAFVYGIPVLEMVTWRGSNLKDDSEPHQEIGNRTSGLTRVIGGDRNVFGSKGGRGLLRAVDKAIERTQAGGIGIIRVSPDEFTETYSLPRTKNKSMDADTSNRVAKLAEMKGTPQSEVYKRTPISRVEAILSIREEHGPKAAYLFSNGFTARDAQERADNLGNFYNAGYMGGTMAVGFGMALSNPGLEVIVVDGDQNAEMSTILPNLAYNYPKNLHWYILDNQYGASVGPSESVPLPFWYYQLAHVKWTVPDNFREFKSPRVGARGKYFDTEEAITLASEIGPLPTHTQRFRHWVDQETALGYE